MPAGPPPAMQHRAVLDAEATRPAVTIPRPGGPEHGANDGNLG
jgi:hypothetical protein